MTWIETVIDVLGLLPGDATGIAVGAILSPAKVVAVVCWLYRSCSPNYADRSWSQFVDSAMSDAERS
jgi:hypothetical protein